jgi:hypothetical protein
MASLGTKQKSTDLLGDAKQLGMLQRTSKNLRKYF